MKNVALGQYFPGDSAIHRLDPRTKIIMAMVMLVVIFLVESFWGFAILAAMLLVQIVISKVGWRCVLRSIRPLWFIIVFTLVLNTFFYTGGTTLAQWGPVRITQEGLVKAIFIAVRLILLIVSTSMMTLTTSPVQLTDAMETLAAPLKKIKVPVHEMAMMMSIALRFIPTLSEETDRIMKAQTARGAEFDSGNLFKKAKNMVPLLVPLFVSAFKRADELALAMEARCYHGGENRTKMKVLHMEKRDVLTLIVLVTSCVLLAVFF